MAGCDKKGMDHTWQPDPRCQKLKRGQVFSVTVKMIKVPYAFLYQLTMNFIVFSEGSLKILNYLFHLPKWSNHIQRSDA